MRSINTVPYLKINPASRSIQSCIFRNYDNYPVYFPSTHQPGVTYSDYSNTYNIYNDNPVYTIYAGSSEPQYTNGRFNAVAQKLSVISDFSAEDDLNESSIGTHV